MGAGAMQLKKLLEKWDLTSLQIKTPFLEMEWQPQDEDPRPRRAEDARASRTW